MRKTTKTSNYRSSCVLILALGVGLSASGCITTSFTQPVASFQQSINTSAAAIGGYYTRLNDFERNLYFDQLAFNGGEALVSVDKQGNRTPLLGNIFSAESIKARTDSLNLLGVYANRLSELAGSDPGAQFQTNAATLGTSLGSLAKSFEELGKQTGPTADPKAAQYAGPISELIGSIGKMYLDAQRDKAIAEAVTNGAPKVDAVLMLLESDLTDVIAPLERTGLKLEVGQSVADYNRRRESLTVEQRRALLATVADRAAAYEAVFNSNPGALIVAIRTANDALVKYANAPKTPQNFNDFSDTLKTLEKRSQEISAEIERIRSIH